eukprot:scaffold1232_cov127-Isochrysis_galbana.AAC.6
MQLRRPVTPAYQADLGICHAFATGSQDQEGQQRGERTSHDGLGADVPPVIQAAGSAVLCAATIVCDPNWGRIHQFGSGAAAPHAGTCTWLGLLGWHGSARRTMHRPMAASAHSRSVPARVPCQHGGSPCRSQARVRAAVGRAPAQF